jgi:hypothetical protein
MTDDEIAERIVKQIRREHEGCDDTDWMSDDVTNFLNHAERYRLAFVADVRERAKVRRQAKRVRAKVFAALGVADRAAV